MNTSLPMAVAAVLSHPRNDAPSGAARDAWSGLAATRPRRGDASGVDGRGTLAEAGAERAPETANRAPKDPAGEPRGSGAPMGDGGAFAETVSGRQAPRTGSADASRTSDPAIGATAAPAWDAARFGKPHFEASFRESGPPPPVADALRNIPFPEIGTAFAGISSASAILATVERVLASAGPQPAAEKLHEALRVSSSGERLRVLDGARPVAGAILDALFATPTFAEPAAKPPGAQTAPGNGAKTLTLLAMALDMGAGTDPARRLRMALAERIHLLVPLEREGALAVLAQGAGIGTGFALPLAVASRFDERERRERRPKLFALLVAGLDRIEHRTVEAEAALMALVGSLVFEWAAWRDTLSPDDCLDRLYDFASRDPRFLEQFESLSRRLDRIGRETLLALEDTASAVADAAFDVARRHLVRSEATEFAVAHSTSARREILRIAAVDAHDEVDGRCLDAVRRAFEGLGFEVDRAAFLADEVVARTFSTPLGAGWTPFDDFAGLRRSGAAFQALLAFLDGTYRVPGDSRRLGFEDLERPLV